MTACQRTGTTAWQGYVEGEFVAIASPQSGQLDALLVQKGQRVTASQPLFVLNAVRERSQLEQAQQQWLAARAQLADLEQGKRAPEVAEVEARLAQALADAERAKQVLKRNEALYREGGVSGQQLDDARNLAAVSDGQVKQQQSALQVARLAARTDQIRAQSALVAAASAAATQATWQLEQTAQRAPQDALVSDTLYRAGDWVAAGQPVLRLLPPRNVKLRFFIGAEALARLPVGASVGARCDGCQPFAAQVSWVAPGPEFTPPVIYSNEQRHKLVWLVEAQPASGIAMALHPGQPVTVHLP
ncbi:HlyD family secretion protein [Chitinilyticum piscinae]|nr:HlyD family efflux transporter periplasmic adaptor subunit [Chitinilyticum piscinae]